MRVSGIRMRRGALLIDWEGRVGGEGLCYGCSGDKSELSVFGEIHSKARSD